MTFDDVVRSWDEAAVGERLGRVVSVRLHVQGPADGTTATDLAAGCLGVCGRVVGRDGVRLRAQVAAGDAQLTVLLDGADGSTALVTAGVGLVDATRLGIVVVGTRGLVDLEEAVLDDGSAGLVSGATPERAAQFREAVAASLAAGASVPFAGCR